MPIGDELIGGQILERDRRDLAGIRRPSS